MTFVLPTEVVNQVCNYLNETDLIALRHANTDLSRKAKHNFGELFESLKINLCKISLEACDELSRDTVIAPKVKELVIGTETLDQYRIAVRALDGIHAEDFQANYRTLVEEDEDNDAAEALRNIVGRLVNLKTIKVEDRPQRPSDHFARLVSYVKDPAFFNFGANYHERYIKNFRFGLDNKKISNLIGVPLSWNGPYPGESYGSSDVFPSFSRQKVFSKAFQLVDEVASSGRLVSFSMSLGGYSSEKWHHHSVPFEINHTLPRAVLGRHLDHLELSGRTMFRSQELCWYDKLFWDTNIELLRNVKSLYLTEFGSDYGHVSFIDIKLPNLTTFKFRQIDQSAGALATYIIMSSNKATLKSVEIEGTADVRANIAIMFSGLTRMPLLEDLRLINLCFLPVYVEAKLEPPTEKYLSSIHWEGIKEIQESTAEAETMVKRCSIPEGWICLNLWAAHQKYLSLNV